MACHEKEGGSLSKQASSFFIRVYGECYAFSDLGAAVNLGGSLLC
jgi:hypothetical protein